MPRPPCGAYHELSAARPVTIWHERRAVELITAADCGDHIVALLAICTDSKLLLSGVFRRVLVDGQSFMDALFACACRG